MSLVNLDLPQVYDDIPPSTRRKVREAYREVQKGKCYYCKESLDIRAPQRVRDKRINRALFPKMFFTYPLHLHHSHDTGLTIGVVHCHCNAILWQYHGE